MTTEACLAAISVGFTALTLVGLYIQWRSLRVVLLRLDLLAIRNKLWDESRELGCLCDPAYQEFRRNLNLMITHAHKIDLISLALSTGLSDAEAAMPSCSNTDLQAALDRALASTVSCMNNYILWHRFFTGIVLVRFLNAAALVSRHFSRFRQFSSTLFRPSAASIRSFARTPDQSTKKWLEHNGPSIVFSPTHLRACA